LHKLKRTKLSLMQYAICSVAAAPVRKEDAHRSEMVHQLLFGETVKILEEKEGWFRVQGTYDGYEGWITQHMLTEIDKEIAEAKVSFVSTGLCNKLMTPDGLVKDTNYTYEGDHRRVGEKFDTDLLLQIVHPWLNAPYLWGGRSFMGVDCSGFVQVVFKILGIPLLRDAYQQATEGQKVDNLTDAIIGDLAFFVNENDRIIHVGILLSDKEIIHASGKVRIDPIDEKGIINKDTKQRTHTLHSIRRYF
jgi:gamma-D-glutamyl-L-lysine dipeptidyl-peptidase